MMRETSGLLEVFTTSDIRDALIEAYGLVKDNRYEFKLKAVKAWSSNQGDQITNGMKTSFRFALPVLPTQVVSSVTDSINGNPTTRAGLDYGKVNAQNIYDMDIAAPFLSIENEYVDAKCTYIVHAYIVWSRQSLLSFNRGFPTTSAAAKAVEVVPALNRAVSPSNSSTISEIMDWSKDEPDDDIPG